MNDSIQRELFKSAFKNVPPDNNDSSVYPELNCPDKSVSGNADSVEANNGKKLIQKCKEANNCQICPIKIQRTIMAKIWPTKVGRPIIAKTCPPTHTHTHPKY